MSLVVQHDRSCAGGAAAMSPTSDLLALCSPDGGSVQVLRWMEWQRVFSCALRGERSAASDDLPVLARWSPDGAWQRQARASLPLALCDPGACYRQPPRDLCHLPPRSLTLPTITAQASLWPSPRIKP